MNDMNGKGRNHARLLAAMLVTGTMLAGGIMLAPGVAAAQDQSGTHSYAIQAGSLSNALNSFAQQSGLQLNYDAALTEGRSTAGLSGQMPWRDALARLLSGSGLVAHAIGTDAVTLTPATTGAMTLETLHVDGATNSSADNAAVDAAEDEEARAGRGESPILVLGHNEQIDAEAATGPWGKKAIIDTPYSINVTSHQMIENMVASDMDQIFKMNPVVQNSAPSTVYGTPYVTIRGYDSQKGVLDGLRLSSTLTGVSTEELERVEIMNGLSGFMYGAGNPGGVTNYVLKRPTTTRLSDITAGNYGGRQWFAHVDLGNRIDKNGTLAYRLNASWQDGKTSKQGQNLARTLISGAVDWHATSNLLVQVEGAHTYYRLDGIDSRFYAYANTSFGALDHWIAPLANNKTYTPGWTYLQVKTDRGGANVTWRINDTFSLRSAYLYKRDLSESANIYPVYYEGAGYANGWPSRSAPTRTTSQGAFSYLDAAFETLGIHHRVTLGVSGDTLQVNSHVVSSISATNSPTYTNPNDLMGWAMPDALKTANWGGTYRSSYATNANIVLGDDIKFTEQLGLMVGVNRTTVMARNYANTGALSSRYNKSAYTPTVSLVYKPGKLITAYASYMQGLEQGTTVPNDATLYTNPGQILKPYLSKQYELGLKYAPSRAILLTGAVFRIEKANSYQTTNSDGRITISQDGVDIHQGVELTATGQVTRNLSVVLGGTVMDLKITKATNTALLGTRPTGVSDNLAKIYLDYSLPWVPGLSVTGGAYHAGKMFKDSANLQKINGYTIFDLGLHYKTQVDKHPLRFDLNVANITGLDYWATSYSLGIPRNVAFSVKYCF